MFFITEPLDEINIEFRIAGNFRGVEFSHDLIFMDDRSKNMHPDLNLRGRPVNQKNWIPLAVQYYNCSVHII